VEIWKPIIAAINGYAVGAGLEIALACDIRIAADHAQMGLPEVRWSLIPAAGGMSRLYRSVPRAIAMRMLLTGERINAEQALQWGLVSDVVPLPDLLPLAHRLADTILDNAPLAVRTVKEVALRGADMPLPDALQLELEAFEPLRLTEDYKEGPVAFSEKRKANYQGH
jgi:enoyl-CoA hydratase/carnithine racemase